MKNYLNLKWLRNYIYCNKNEYKIEEWTFIIEKLDNIIKNYKGKNNYD